MRSQSIFSEYIWLVGTIHRARRITLREINNKWQQTTMSEGKPMSRSTFNRHKESIEEIFGICIDCDMHDGFRYFIRDSDNFNNGTVKDWMISTLSLNTMISESKSLQSRILTEPMSHNDNLPTIIEAMKEFRKIKISYRKYGSQDVKEKVLEPFCMKVYHQRWYLLGHTDGKNQNFITYALDRIVEVAILDENFCLGDFDAAEYFRDCYGIFNNIETKPERVVIKAHGVNQVNALRDLPLHHSQREIETLENDAIFEYFLKPSLDFQGQIMSRGSWLEVLEPQSLIDSLRQAISEALKYYTSQAK